MTDAQVISDINANVNTNGTGFITGAIANAVLKTTMWANIHNKEIGTLTNDTGAVVNDDTILVGISKLNAGLQGLGTSYVPLGGTAAGHNVTGEIKINPGIRVSSTSGSGLTAKVVASLYDSANGIMALTTYDGVVEEGASAKLSYLQFLLTGQASFGGAKYASDYSSNFTSRSLPDIAYVGSMIYGSMSSGYLPKYNGTHFVNSSMREDSGGIVLINGKYISSSTSGKSTLDFGSGDGLNWSSDAGAFAEAYILAQPTKIQMGMGGRPAISLGDHNTSFSNDTLIEIDAPSVVLLQNLLQSAATGKSQLNFGAGGDIIDLSTDGGAQMESGFFADNVSVSMYAINGNMYANVVQTYLRHDTLMTFDAPDIRILQNKIRSGTVGKTLIDFDGGAAFKVSTDGGGFNESYISMDSGQAEMASAGGYFYTDSTQTAIENIAVVNIQAPTVNVGLDSTVINFGTGGSNTTVFNFGDQSTMLDTFNFYGQAFKIITTDTFVKDKLVRYNYGGTAASGAGTGWEGEENSVVNMYNKIDAGRTGFLFKAPTTNQLTLLLSSLSANHILTAPNLDGIIATTNGGQTFTSAIWNGTAIGASYLADNYANLTDVTVTSVSNGQLMKYDSGTGKWINFTPSYISSLSGALLAANNLSDVASASSARTNLGLAIGTNVQAWDADLDAIAAISATSGLLKKTAANTWTLDTNTYLTSNQSITLSGEATGSGATAITVTLSNAAVIGKVLTSYVRGAGTVSAADNILQSIQKLDGNIAAVVSSQWVTSGADVYYNAGNVMVGSTGSPLSKLHIVETSTSTPRGILADQYSTTGGSRITMRTAGGTFASPSAVATGRALASWTAAGHDGTNFIDNAKILVTSAGVISTGIVPTTMALQTMNASGALVTAITIDQLQNVLFAGIVTGSSVTQSPYDNSTKFATTAYVDAAVANLDAKPEVSYASTSPLPANTYSNGSSGVGATLTGNSNGPLLMDGVTILLAQAGAKVLVAGESTSAYNGWYTITQVGVVAVSPYILTRDVQSDQATEIGAGYLTSVIAPNGVVAGSNNGKVFISVAADPFVVGTTALTFSAVGGTYASGNGLGLSGITFSIDTSITVDKTTAQTLTNKSLLASSNVIGGVTMTLGSDATGDMYYRNSGGILTRLGVGSIGQVMTISGSSLPSWGAASPLTTKGDIYVYSTTNDRLAVGADATIIIADSSAARGVKYAAISGDATLATSGALTIGTNKITYDKLDVEVQLAIITSFKNLTNN